MKSIFRMAAGGLLITAALLGLVTGGAGLVLFWRFESQAVRSLDEGAGLLDRTLTASGELIHIISGILDDSTASVALIEKTMQNAAEAMKSSAKMTESVGEMFEGELSLVVEKTQQSISGVQSSAKVIDGTLRILSAVPFLGVGYKPEVPLQDSIAEVSESLEPVPGSLKTVGADMATMAKDIGGMEPGLKDLATQLGDIRTELESSKSILKEYSDILAELQNRLGQIRRSLPVAVRVVAWGVTLLLIWLMIAQIGLLTQGFELIQRGREGKKE